MTMWYAPHAGVLGRAADRAFGIVNFDLASSADLATLRARAGLPDPSPPVPTSIDSRRRHREAATEACGGRKCVTPPARPPID